MVTPLLWEPYVARRLSSMLTEAPKAHTAAAALNKGEQLSWYFVSIKAAKLVNRANLQAGHYFLIVSREILNYQ